MEVIRKKRMSGQGRPFSRIDVYSSKPRAEFVRASPVREKGKRQKE